MSEFLRKLGWLAHRRRREDDLRAELQFHLDEEAERLQQDGLAERQARSAARRELGNLGLVAENARAAWGWTVMEQLGQDLRYAFRTMAANRLFAILAALSLALGIGANAAIYSFMDALLLRSLPVSEPDRLVLLNWHAKVDLHRLFVIHEGHGSDWGDGLPGLEIREHAGDGAARGAGAGSGRDRHRPANGAGVVQTGGLIPVRDEGERSIGIGGGSGDSACRRDGGGLSAGAESRAGGSYGALRNE
jgi:hypothetical protein